MVSEARKQSMAWMETDYSKHTYSNSSAHVCVFCNSLTNPMLEQAFSSVTTVEGWKIKWRLEYLGALGIMVETVPLSNLNIFYESSYWENSRDSSLFEKVE